MAKTKADEKKVNKSKLVAEAMEKLGHDAGPKAIMEYVQKNHGIEINYGMVASYKSIIRSRKAAGGAPAGRRAAGGKTIEMRDMIVVRELLDRLGEPQLQSLIKVLKK